MSEFFIGMAVGSFLGAMFTLTIVSMCMKPTRHNSDWYGNHGTSQGGSYGSNYGDNWYSWTGWNRGGTDNHRDSQTWEDQTDDRTQVRLLPGDTVNALRNAESTQRELNDTQREIREKGIYVWVWSMKYEDWVMRPVEVSIGGHERFHLFSWSDSRSSFVSKQATNDFMKLKGAKEYLEQLDDVDLHNELCNFTVELKDEQGDDDEPMKTEQMDDGDSVFEARPAGRPP